MAKMGLDSLNFDELESEIRKKLKRIYREKDADCHIIMIFANYNNFGRNQKVE